MVGIKDYIGSCLRSVEVFAWLVAAAVKNQVNWQIITRTLRSQGLGDGFGAYVDHLVDADLENEPGVYPHALTVCGLRLLSVVIVTDPALSAPFYNLPFRSQFELPSVLALRPGRDVFFHQQLYGAFHEDKKLFKRVLYEDSQPKQLVSNLKRHLFVELNNADQWRMTPVDQIMRRIVFCVLAETYFGLEAEALLEEYDELVVLLDQFDEMWQNPERMGPLTMYGVLRRLDALSSRLDAKRSAALLLDSFAQKYGRPLNMTVLFFVSANLIQALVHTIVMCCTCDRSIRNEIKSELTPDAFYRDIIHLILTDRFRDSRVFRIVSGLYFTGAPNGLQFGGHEISSRTVYIFPQGDLNKRRIDDHSYKNAQGRIKEPFLFGKGRPCPGAPSVYKVLQALLEFVDECHFEFNIDDANLIDYRDYIEHCHSSAAGRGSAPPPVYGVWNSKRLTYA